MYFNIMRRKSVLHQQQDQKGAVPTPQSRSCCCRRTWAGISQFQRCTKNSNFLSDSFIQYQGEALESARQSLEAMASEQQVEQVSTPSQEAEAQDSLDLR